MNDQQDDRSGRRVAHEGMRSCGSDIRYYK